MTIQELEAMFDIERALNKQIQKLEKLNNKSLAGAYKFAGISRNTTTQSQTEQYIIEKEATESAILDLRKQAWRQAAKLYRYICTLDDALMWLIIELHCIELKQWDEAAREIGGDCTADSIRATYKRFVKKLPEV